MKTSSWLSWKHWNNNFGNSFCQLVSVGVKNSNNLTIACGTTRITRDRLVFIFVIVFRPGEVTVFRPGEVTVNDHLNVVCIVCRSHNVYHQFYFLAEVTPSPRISTAILYLPGIIKTYILILIFILIAIDWLLRAQSQHFHALRLKCIQMTWDLNTAVLRCRC